MLDRALPCPVASPSQDGSPFAIRVAACALLALAGCSGADDTGVAADPPSAYTYTPDEQVDEADPVVMQAEIQALLADLRTITAEPAVDAWFQVREHGDQFCPDEATSSSEGNGDVVYFDRLCVVEDRVWFKGPMTSYTFTDNTLNAFDVYDILPYLRGEEAVMWTGRAIKGQTDVYDTQSDLDYNCSCTAFIAENTIDPNQMGWVSYMDGPTHFTAPEADADAWMNRGMMSTMWMRFGRDASINRWNAQIEGSVTGHGDVYGNVYIETRLGGERRDGVVLCDPGSTAIVSARHSLTGRRTDMSFTFEAGSCVSCASVGDGEVCIDLAPIGDFEDAPW